MSDYKATLDYETRSSCSIRRSGSWKYSLDSSTEVLCAAFRLPYWEEGRTELWHPAFPIAGIEEACSDWDALLEFFEWVEQGGLVEAHNAWFERGITANIMVPVYGWPEVPHTSWRCSAAKAAAHALPRGLEDCGVALGVKILKDTEGGKVMKKMAKPRKPRKKELIEWQAKHGDAPIPLLYHESKELFEILWAYCRQDVLAEEAFSEALDDLSDSETAMYLMDQSMNERGVQLDLTAVSRALGMIAAETAKLNAELCKLTGGQPDKATKRAKMLEWFASEGLNLPDTQAETIEWALTTESHILTDKARRGLELLKALSKSSTAKFESMRNWANADGKARGMLLYHGASTGRWAGSGPQPHNFPRGTLKDPESPKGEAPNIETLWQEILKWPAAKLMRKYKASVLEILSHALRGAITASPGKQLYVADYSGIEARVLLWLADDHEGLEVFRRGDCLYCEMASSPELFNRKITKADKAERALGKVAVLGLGYGMGSSKFVDTAWDLGGIKLEEYSDDPEEMTAKRVVDAYRNKFWRVKSMWYEQERAAIRAVQTGRAVDAGYVTWVMDDRFLYCILPSGRKLAYIDPLIKEKETPWGEMRPQLTFMGINPMNKKWQRQSTYGGSIVENITQAVARDIMAHAMLACERGGKYSVILSVHDELIAEADEGVGSVHEFESILTDIPDWAAGCPISAEGWRGFRYHK